MRTPRTTTPGPGAPAGRPATPPRGRRAHAGRPADERPEPETGASAGRRPRHGSLRPRTVRAKIISLLMVPVVSLLALWGFATVTTAQDVARLREVRRLDTTVRGPVTEAVRALQDERTAALRQLAAPGTGHAATLRERAGRTDAALKALSIGGGHTVADAGLLPVGTAARLTAFLDEVKQVRTVRTRLLSPSRNGSGAPPAHRYRWAGHGCGETRGHRDAERLHAVRRRRHRGSRRLRIADGNSGGRDRIEDTCPARTDPQRRDAGA